MLDIWDLERELKEVLEDERKLVVESLKELALCGKGSETLRRLTEGVNTNSLEERKKFVEAMSYVRSNSGLD